MGASSSFLSTTEYPLRRTLKGSLSCSSIKRCEVMCFFQKSANACFITERWTVGWRSTSSWCCRFAEKGVTPEYSRRPSLALLCWTANCPLTASHPLKIQQFAKIGRCCCSFGQVWFLPYLRSAAVPFGTLWISFSESESNFFLRTESESIFCRSNLVLNLCSPASTPKYTCGIAR